MKGVCVTCDTSGCLAAYYGEDWAGMWKRAKSEGWTKDVGSSPARHRCPACTKDRRRGEFVRLVRLAVEDANGRLPDAIACEKPTLAEAFSDAAARNLRLGHYERARMFAIVSLSHSITDLQELSAACLRYMP